MLLIAVKTDCFECDDNFDICPSCLGDGTTCDDGHELLARFSGDRVDSCEEYSPWVKERKAPIWPDGLFPDEDPDGEEPPEETGGDVDGNVDEDEMEGAKDDATHDPVEEEQSKTGKESTSEQVEVVAATETSVGGKEDMGQGNGCKGGYQGVI